MVQRAGILAVMARCSGQSALIAAVVLSCTARGIAAQQVASSRAEEDSIAAGAALFSGEVRFATNGPACIACHSAAGLPFPNGGTLGPDLTHAYARMGPLGIDSALRTLYFPTMYPLYKRRPLASDEQAKLAAFLKHTSTRSSAPSTMLIIGISVGLYCMFMLFIGYAWRGRVHSTRQSLVNSARARALARAGAEMEPTGNPPTGTPERDLD